MSDAVAVSETKAPAPTSRPLKDFKDWLSPMLVKELRQGLRTRVFVMAFILLQAAIMVVMLGAAGSGASGRSTAGLWFVTAIVLLAAMPLRGFSALSNEMRMKTMDLLTLTRLSAFRITFGKWAALYSQSLLLAVALMPYVVIRYFLGGVDLATELLVLFLMTLLSGVLTAVTVGFSAHPSILLRGAVAVLVLIFGSMMIGEFLEDIFRSGWSPVTADNFWLLLAGIVTFAVFVSYYLLDMGASQFAPFAENHSTRKRLAGLGFVAVIFLCAFLADDSSFAENLFALLVVSMTVVCIDALTEQQAPVPSLYVPFVRRGVRGRMFGKLFYPGWHTGLWYSALVGLLVMVYYYAFGSGYGMDEDMFIAILAIVGQLLFPVVILKLFFRRTQSQFALYILIQCITLPMVGLLGSIDDGEGMLWLACPIPVAQLMIHGSSYRYGDISVFVPFVFTASYFVLLFVLSLNCHREERRLVRIAAAAIALEAKEAAR